ncbi:hypothetical protein BGX27_004966, partial [Mortierella sp. AM989]
EKDRDDLPVVNIFEFEGEAEAEDEADVQLDEVCDVLGDDGSEIDEEDKSTGGLRKVAVEEISSAAASIAILEGDDAAVPVVEVMVGVNTGEECDRAVEDM